MDWRDRARRQAGVISRRQLAHCAVSEDRIDGLVRRSDLLEVLPGVYLARPAEPSMRQRLWAAQLWSGGVISHRSAAALWKLPVGPSTTVHLTVADGRYRRGVPSVRTHRVPLARLHHLWFDGLRVTDRTRTVIDLLRTESLGVARDLLDRAVQRGWLTEYDLDADDVAFPEQRLAIEVDGRRTYGEGSDRFEDDRARQNELIAASWRVIRVTWTMLTRYPDAVIAQITVQERTRSHRHQDRSDVRRLQRRRRLHGVARTGAGRPTAGVRRPGQNGGEQGRPEQPDEEPGRTPRRTQIRRRAPAAVVARGRRSAATRPGSG